MNESNYKELYEKLVKYYNSNKFIYSKSIVNKFIIENINKEDEIHRDYYTYLDHIPYFTSLKNNSDDIKPIIFENFRILLLLSIIA